MLKKEVMSSMFTLLVIISLLCVISVFAFAAENDPLPHVSVPADGKITLVNYGNRNWGPEPVHYTLDTKRFQPGKLVLLDSSGKAVPFQIAGDTLTFVATLPKDATVTYTLQASPTDRSAENTSLVYGEKDGAFEMRNNAVALRMPVPGKKIFTTRIAAGEATPPILGWTNTGNPWEGKAYFHTARKVASQAFSIIQQGPACVEYEARYTFEPKGEYVWRIRLSPEMPLAIVSEEFDFNAVTKGEDLLLFELNAGWQPQYVEGAAYNDYITRGTRNAQRANADKFAPKPYVPEQGMVFISKHNPGGRWSGHGDGIQMWDGIRDNPANGRNIGFVVLSVGAWRGMMSMNVWYKEGAGLVLGLPISVRPSRWNLDGADDISPFSNHEHDPGLKPTYGRRVWGLYTGNGRGSAQAYYGFIGLDRYKDWVLEWPENPKVAKYPGCFISPEQLERLRKSIDQHPDKEYLQQNYYMFNGRVERS